MAGRGRACAFCGATADLVPTGVLDEKWSRRFGGEPVVALDHGWYTTVLGERRAADRLDPAKFFGPQVRALCDFCVHGWVEDVRWRAEPTLLALAQGTPYEPRAGEVAAVHRWARLTALLAELIDGMPRAASAEQRGAVRRGGEVVPAVHTWFFALRQRLPARVHLSQVEVPHDGPTPGLVQIVSVDLAHLSVLVVVPSDATAAAVVDRSAVVAALGTAGTTASGAERLAHPLDLARTRHPHAVAVHRVCSANEAAEAEPT